MLMNTVLALRKLALGDYDSRITDGTEYNSDSYPEVSILVSTPKRLRTIPTAIIVWAITAGAYKMISERKIELSQFEIRDRDRLVGWVHIIPNSRPPGDLVLPGSSSNSADRTVIRRHIRPRSASNEILIDTDTANVTSMDSSNITNFITTNLANTDPEEARLITTFTPFGNLLSIYDVFIPIFGGLAELARYPGNGRTQYFIEERAGYRGCICITSTPLIIMQPPYLEYQWLARAIARIPADMLSRGRFGEIKIVMEVDRTMVGMGRMGTLEGLCE